MVKKYRMPMLKGEKRSSMVESAIGNFVTRKDYELLQKDYELLQKEAELRLAVANKKIEELEGKQKGRIA